MLIDPAQASTRDLYQLMISAIVPRPIAFVSTLNRSGIVNLAPFSYFNAVSSKPPLVSLSISKRRWQGALVKKDTWRNIEETGELVIHIGTEALVAPLNQCSAEYPPECSELEAVGLTPLASTRVRPPRLKESPIALECRLERIIELGAVGLVIAEVLCFHVDEAVWDAERAGVDPEKLRPVARLGGSSYSKLGEVFSLPRPDWEGKGMG